jgi:hypothetical protein
MNRDSLTISLPICIPFISSSCLIVLARNCRTMLNRSGESGHSCLIPDFLGKWFLLPYHELLAKMISKRHTHCRELLGHVPSNIVVLFSKDQHHWFIFWDRSGNIFHIQNFYSLPFLYSFVFPKSILSSPLLEAVTIFTGASGCSTAAYYTKDWHKVEHTVFAFTQRAEFYVVVNLFFQLCSLVQTHLYPCFVSNLCSHSNLPGPLANGNAQADNLVSGLALGLLMQIAAPVQAAKLSHALYHQNPSALRSMPPHTLVRPLSMS